jgi:hypothetical protein
MRKNEHCDREKRERTASGCTSSDGPVMNGGVFHATTVIGMVPLDQYGTCVLPEHPLSEMATRIVSAPL